MRHSTAPAVGLLCFALGLGASTLPRAIRSIAPPERATPARATDPRSDAAASVSAAYAARVRAALEKNFDEDLSTARAIPATRHLSAFDDVTTPPPQSRPVLDANGLRSPNPLDTCTSLLGNFSRWASGRALRGIPPSSAAPLGDTAVNVSLGLAREKHRETGGGRGARYVLLFVLDVRVVGTAGGAAEYHQRLTETASLEE